ncbi:MAG: type II toxin-antitoxin system RelB/DinJ family antitoxin [Lachnospiraceae bacterium]|nr:type II toxin-antitoxin system RelB/DinJ family antitoxin [Lachnospiraceae bacterium]
MAKTANLYARIEPEVKEQAEEILEALGISTSSAISMYYKQIILHRGIPFDVKIPAARPLDASKLTEEQFDAELQKGLDDIKAGRTKPAKETFAEIRRDYGL